MIPFVFVTLVVGMFLMMIKKRLDFWKDREIVIPKNIFAINKQLFTLEKSPLEIFKNIYREFKSQGLKHGGIFLMFWPSYVPVDLNIIKLIMQVDSHNFLSRGLYLNEKGDPLSAHLITLSGDKWKLLRHKLTPAFTSGKMKMMFETLLDCTKGLCKVIDKESGEAVEMKDVLGRFTTDIVVSTAFGLDCNSLENPECELRKLAKVFMQQNIKRLLLLIAPKFMLKFNLRILPKDVSDGFMELIRETISNREKNKIFRKDFMHLLIQLKNRGMVTNDEDLFGTNYGGNGLTIEEIAAQALIFFMAGYETTSITSTFCLYELAKNKTIQNKARHEIMRVLNTHGGKLTYEAQLEMSYLEQTINETLRKYPPVPFLPRVCNEDYQVPGTDLILKAGIKVIIPVIGVHHDPEYYPEPDVFDPDRFSEENKQKRPAFSFLPYGEGPRYCIGARFGMTEVKVCLVALLSHYEISLSEKTKQPIVYDASNYVTTSIKGGMWLNFKRISQTNVNN